MLAEIAVRWCMPVSCMREARACGVSSAERHQCGTVCDLRHIGKEAPSPEIGRPELHDLFVWTDSCTPAVHPLGSLAAHWQSASRRQIANAKWLCPPLVTNSQEDNETEQRLRA